MSRIAVIFMLLTIAVQSDAHVLDEVFDKANRAGNRSDSKVDSSVYGDMSSASNNAREKALVVDEKIDRFRSKSEETESQTSASEKRTPTQKTSKTYACKIYCKSASGPTITREVQATNRREAAKYVGDNAHNYCSSAGYSNASRHDFPENQCQEK